MRVPTPRVRMRGFRMGVLRVDCFYLVVQAARLGGFAQLLVAEGFDGVQAGGLRGGVDAEEETDGGGYGDGEDCDVGGDYGGQLLAVQVHAGDDAGDGQAEPEA